MDDMWLAIVLAGAGTYAQRASFLAFAHRLTEVPAAAARILRQIPAAVLAALVVPALVRPEGTLDLWQPRLIAGVLAAVVSWKTRSVGATLAVGMIAVVVLERVM